jgi:hypothetical protein
VTEVLLQRRISAALVQSCTRGGRTSTAPTSPTWGPERYIDEMAVFLTSRRARDS